MTLKEIQNLVKKISERFSEKEDVFNIVVRLLEECGEVASEIRKIEKRGSKVYFGISGDKEKLAEELVDVLSAVAAIANFYDLELEEETDKIEARIKETLKIND